MVTSGASQLTLFMKTPRLSHLLEEPLQLSNLDENCTTCAPSTQMSSSSIPAGHGHLAMDTQHAFLA